MSGDDSNISQTKLKAEASYGHVQNAEALVVLYEAMLGISEWWTSSSAEYKQYYKENVETTYRKAVDELERSVVMRIMELGKMRATGTGTCNINYQFELTISETTYLIRLQTSTTYFQGAKSTI